MKIRIFSSWSLVGGLCFYATCFYGEVAEGSQSFTFDAEELSDFPQVTGDEFRTMQGDPLSELLGCVCVKRSERWQAWKFLVRASDGVRTPLTSSTHLDIERCVAERERSAQKCGGAP